MTGPPTQIEVARKHARQLADNLRVRIFLYKDLAGSLIFRSIHPAKADEDLELIETFEPPPARGVFDQSLPPAPPSPPASE